MTSVFVLSCRLVKCKINGASDNPPMKPAVTIDSQGLSSKFLEMTWLMYRLEQRQEACTSVSKGY